MRLTPLISFYFLRLLSSILYELFMALCCRLVKILTTQHLPKLNSKRCLLKKVYVFFSNFKNDIDRHFFFCNMSFFFDFQIKKIKETSLSANQDKSETKTMTWKVEGQTQNRSTPKRGRPVDESSLVVELGPMEIRTFILTF